ncbi:MAG: hypothetical protein V2A65_09270 [Candidatus Omnitrophota bacterium]
MTALVRNRFFFSAVILFWSFQTAWAQTISLVKTEDGNYRLRNEFVSLTVDAGHGGRIVQFAYLPTGHEYAGGKGLSLAIDHFWEQPWPGELMDAAYEVVGQNADDNRVSLKLRRTVSGRWGEKMQNNLAGLVFEKEIGIETGSRAVQVQVRVLNFNSSPRNMQYWAQHIYTLGGRPEDQTYYRPGLGGIISGRFEHGGIGDDWVRDPIAGWSAGHNQKTGNSLLFLVDFQKLDAFYNCLSAGTHEWLMEPAVIPPNSSWETAYLILPYRQDNPPVFASNDFILGIEFLPASDRLGMRLTAQSGAKPGGEFTWQAETLLFPDRKIIDKKSEHITLSDFASWKKEAEIGKYGTDDLVIKSSVGNQNKAIFETLFGGKQAQRTSMGLPPNRYKLLGPEAKKTDNSKEDSLESGAEPRTRKTGKVLYVHGLYAPLWKVSGAVKAAGLTVEDAYFQKLVNAEQKIYGYPDKSALDDYDAVMLADVPAAAMRNDGLRSLVNYVRRGGGLLVLGGPTSFGNGGYDDTVMDSLIPFRITGPFDNQPVPEGERRLGRPGGILPKTLDFSKNPSVFWANKPGELKTGAEVWLQFGSKPLIAAWQVGGGRVVAVTGSVLGTPGPGEMLFTEWVEWPNILQLLIQWIGGGSS